MKNFAEKTKVAVFEKNEKGEMKQNVRNAFKADVMKAFTEFMVANGFDAMQTADGTAVRFENDEDGAVAVVFNGTVKGFGFDVDFENAEFVKDKAEKAEKAEKAKAEKEKKIAETKANAVKKEKVKA